MAALSHIEAADRWQAFGALFNRFGEPPANAPASPRRIASALFCNNLAHVSFFIVSLLSAIWLPTACSRLARGPRPRVNSPAIESPSSAHCMSNLPRQKLLTVVDPPVVRLTVACGPHHRVNSSAVEPPSTARCMANPLCQIFSAFIYPPVARQWLPVDRHEQY